MVLGGGNPAVLPLRGCFFLFVWRWVLLIKSNSLGKP